MTFISLDLLEFLSGFLPILMAFDTVAFAPRKTLKMSVAHSISSILRDSASWAADSGAL